MISRFRLQDINPLANLREGDIPRMALDSLKGDLPDWAWLIYWLTRSNYAVTACVKKLQDALAVMDWDIKKRPNLKPEQEAVADRQQEGLRSAYDKIGNLKAACKRLAMGEFYGYAHLNKIYAGGLEAPEPAKGKPGAPGYVAAKAGDARYKQGSWDVVELRFVEPWYWSRHGFGGAWLYNPEARSGEAQGTPINTRDWIIREVEPPLGDVIARAHHKMEMADEDWADHDDRFAVPPVFIEGPPNVSSEQEDDFQDVAERVVSNGSGYIPHGAKVHTVTVPDGGECFKMRLGTWESAIVLVVTRGKLTMLSEPQGIGSGSSEEHGDGWDDVAAALALDVSETLQRDFDLAVLADVTPGEPPYAYFEFARQAEKDAKAHLDNAVLAKEAGYSIGVEELSEKTGYELTEAVAAPEGAGKQNSNPASQTAPPPGAATVSGTDPEPKAVAAPGVGEVPAPVEPSPAQPTAADRMSTPQSEPPPIARPSRAGEASPGIVSAALANAVGLEGKWLAPVLPLLAEVEAALADQEKSLEDVEAILQRVHDALPALLPELDIAAFAKLLEEAGTPAVLQGTMDALSAKKERRAK